MLVLGKSRRLTTKIFISQFSMLCVGILDVDLLGFLMSDSLIVSIILIFKLPNPFYAQVQGDELHGYHIFVKDKVDDIKSHAKEESVYCIRIK